MLHLTQAYSAQPNGTSGTLSLCLHNLSDAPLRFVRLCYTSLARVDHSTTVTGGTLIRSEGSFVEIVPSRDIPAHGQTEIRLEGLIYPARTRCQGVLSAWVDTASGPVEATIGDLEAPDGTDPGPGLDWPQGAPGTPLGLVPFPAEVHVTDWGPPSPLYPGEGTDPGAFMAVARLHRRLFPYAEAPLSATPLAGGRAVKSIEDPDLPAGGYGLSFHPDRVYMRYGDADGLRHGLISLAQIAHHARVDPRLQFPQSGSLSDTPRFGWRGLMFDVVRNFFEIGMICRVLDIMAWLKMNRFHWHLTDDEGWRMPSRAFPDLNTTGATRSMNHPIPPQYGDGPEGQSGSYSEADVAAVLSHAGDLGIQVMPEVEMPGHAAALIASVPGLRDPDEPNGAYRSVQGHLNNALNPGLPRSYEVATTLLDEAAALFPFDTIHVGADEVEHTAWAASPAAQRFAKEQGLKTTHAQQSHFLRRMQAHLGTAGRRIAAWDEAAEGGGIDPEGAILFAWRSTERVAELIARGYDVVATPGQAYYLDMVQSPGWNARGISWAGAATPGTTYTYEAGDGLPAGPGRLLGVQAAIWTEYLRSRADINHMAFPRLPAVAEAAWTPPEGKSWTRFAALSRLIPQL